MSIALTQVERHATYVKEVVVSHCANRAIEILDIALA
jgi:hypothetical protein